MIFRNTLALMGSLVLASCAFWSQPTQPNRQIQNINSSLEKFTANPVEWADDLIVTQLGGNIESYCKLDVPQLTQMLSLVDFDSLNKQVVETSGAEFLKKSFLVKRAFNANLPLVSKECRQVLVPFFRELRQVEDYIGELAYKEKDRNASDIDFTKVPVPILDEKSYSPYQTVPEYRNQKGFAFEAGDVVLTRGISFSSATISQSTDDRTHFSHGVFIHKETGKDKLQSIESYLQTGTRYYSIEDAMKNENVRIAVFRPRDRTLGQKASDMMAKKLNDANQAGTGIPYDYAMDLKEYSKMTCAEIIIASYDWASNGTLLIPEQTSNVRITSPYFLKKINVKPGKTFSPVNMEIDSRFEFVMEWRDYSIVRDQRQKDMIAKKVIDWIENEKYLLKGTLTTFGIKAAWSMRKVPFIWNIISKPLKLDNIQKDMPAEFLVTVAQLRDVGQILLNVTKKADDAHKKKFGYPMSEKKLQAFLEEFRLKDKARFEKYGRASFHHLLRAN